MLRKAAIQTSKSLRMSRRHRIPNGSFPNNKRISDGYEAPRTLSSLPLHSFHPSNSLKYPMNDDEDEHNSHLTLQPISLWNNHHNTLQHNQLNHQLTKRHYHTTPHPERGAVIVLSLGAVAATAKAGQYIVQGYKEWKEASEAAAKEEEERRAELKARGIDVDVEEKKQREEEAEASAKSESSQQTSSGDAGKKAEEGKRENFFAKFFNLSVGSKYYEGERSSTV
jgi:hypothetical protein